MFFNLFKKKKPVQEEEVGIVEHWFGNIKVAGLKITQKSIQVGEMLHYKGHTTDFMQEIKSIQKEHKSIQVAKKGDEIGIEVKKIVREHDKVFKVIDAG